MAFKRASGETVMHYSGLHAHDAKGRALPAEMKVSEGRVVLEVEEGDAVYPLTIDPLFTRLFMPQQKLTDSNVSIHGRLGYSVAISGNTIVVGIPEDDNGSANVFVGL
jgi:hypothetical protein